MLHQEKPSLDDLTIQHYGITGMRWGIRRHATGGEIRIARRSAARTKMAVEDTRHAVRAGFAPKESLAKAKLAHLNNPDRATAARITRGEIAVSAILLTPVGTMGLITGSQVRSRFIQGRQKVGYYDRLARFQEKQNAKRNG